MRNAHGGDWIMCIKNVFLFVYGLKGSCTIVISVGFRYTYKFARNCIIPSRWGEVWANRTSN